MAGAATVGGDQLTEGVGIVGVGAVGVTRASAPLLFLHAAALLLLLQVDAICLLCTLLRG